MEIKKPLNPELTPEQNPLETASTPEVVSQNEQPVAETTISETVVPDLQPIENSNVVNGNVEAVLQPTDQQISTENIEENLIHQTIGKVDEAHAATAGLIGEE